MIEIVDIVVGNDETENHTLVMFSNNSYACSCGIHSQDAKLPSLRAKHLEGCKRFSTGYLCMPDCPVTLKEIQDELGL